MTPKQQAVIVKLQNDRDKVVADYNRLIDMLRAASYDPHNAGPILDMAADAEFSLALEVERVDEFATLLGYETSDESKPEGKYLPIARKDTRGTN